MLVSKKKNRLPLRELCFPANYCVLSARSRLVSTCHGAISCCAVASFLFVVVTSASLVCHFFCPILLGYEMLAIVVVVDSSKLGTFPVTTSDFSIFFRFTSKAFFPFPRVVITPAQIEKEDEKED